MDSQHFNHPAMRHLAITLHVGCGATVEQAANTIDRMWAAPYRRLPTWDELQTIPRLTEAENTAMVAWQDGDHEAHVAALRKLYAQSRSPFQEGPDAAVTDVE